MRRERLYLDTSVLNVYRDPRDPFLQQKTREFWEKLPRYEVFISEVVLAEIRRASEPVQAELIELSAGMTPLALTEEAVQLAELYLAEGVFSPRDLNDAQHVAVATVAGMDYLVSWNFRHLVKVKTRRLVNLVNAKEGYRSVEIVAPSEL